MKYLKLFEKFIDEPKFYRFNQTDLLGQEDSMQLSARQRTMVGPENVNSVLVKNKFPDKKNCIHFMDEKAFDPKYKTIYGRFIYEVKIDDTSKLGWSFFIPVNDWFYKSHPYYQLTRYPEKLPDVVKDLLNSEYSRLDYPYGKHPVFVWTNDDVIIKRYVEPAREPREARPYKNRPLLTEEDFTNNGVSSEKIKDFYSSDAGRSLRRLQMRTNENPDRFSEFKEEALRLLKVWIENQI